MVISYSLFVIGYSLLIALCSLLPWLSFQVSLRGGIETQEKVHNRLLPSRLSVIPWRLCVN